MPDNYGDLGDAYNGFCKIT